MPAEMFYTDCLHQSPIPAAQRVIDRRGPFATFTEAVDAGNVPGIECFTIAKVYVPDAPAPEPGEEPAKSAKPAAKPTKKTTKKTTKKATSS